VVVLAVVPAEAGKVIPPPKLSADVGPSGELSLKGPRRRPVRSLPAGWYTVNLQDRSAAAQFHLFGPATNMASGLRFRGGAQWGVHFVRGTYRYTNDLPRRSTTRSFKVS
jgi:hypothetical protein